MKIRLAKLKKLSFKFIIKRNKNFKILKATLGTSLGGLVKEVFNYKLVKEFITSCESHCSKLVNEANQHNVTNAVDYCLNNPFCDDFCTFEKYFEVSNVDLLNKVKNETIEYEEIWKISEKLTGYIKDSKVAIINKQMQNFIIANSLIVLYQAQNIFSIYLIIKESGKSIENESLFDEIKEKIESMNKKLEQLKSAKEDQNLLKIITIKTQLDSKLNEARNEIAKIDKSLFDIESDLNYAVAQSKSNGILNFIQAISTSITLAPRFQSANKMFKITSLIFGPLAYSILSLANAKNYSEANKKLVVLKETQKELKLLAKELEEIGNKMTDILECNIEPSKSL